MDPNYKPKPPKSKEERRATGPKSIARLRRKQARKAARGKWDRLTPEERYQQLLAEQRMMQP